MIEYESLKNSNKNFVEEFKAKFLEVLDSGWYILGEQLKKFETEFALYQNMNFCQGVSSGTDAIVLALDALNLPKNSEVIVSGNTYITTILSIVRNGLKPVIVDAKIDTYNIDPQLITKAISKNTRAILVTHMYGKLCEMDLICKIAKDNNFFLIEDCAQAHGASINGKKAGSFGDLGCFSFYPTKNLGALGDAGAIVTNSQKLSDRILLLRNNGVSTKYVNDIIGYNSRLDELQASFLSVKLKYIEEITDYKISLARLYRQYLSPEIVQPIHSNDYKDVFHIFNIRHQRRDDLRKYLLESGVKTEIHYPVAPHLQEALSDLNYQRGDFPVTEEICSTTLSLPISYGTTKKEVKIVAELINQFK